ncbi:hypothetical protein SBOR_6283 [Sclerotinia borealis F-4128]|uniref:DUF6604 domain-containing protein n=1 Tax=Sclerotinia borealis (strain F-4128) TaxID=1432307 RepID=W9CFP4_SCLBF|nr:hypothetical protein SBOR_6283 [Sclerotinia borealis F-4128]
MLPEGLSSSYKRYKDDTNVFSTWLAQTAIKCGYKPDTSTRRVFSNASITSESSSHSASSSSSIFSATSTTSTSSSVSNVSNFSSPSKPANPSATSTRLKGKARKNAKKAQVSAAKPSPQVFETTVVIISTRDLVEQAKVIAEQRKTAVIFPSVIHRVAERAIRARKRFLKWFQQARAEDEEVNASHEHFIGVLETILDILTPCYEINKRKNGQGVSTEPKANENLDIPTNMFEILDVEDIADEDLATADLKSGTAKVNTNSTPLETYELDTDPDIDVPFIAFCFFEDLHRIQEFVGDTWKSHANGNLDISSAYLLTNYAVNIVSLEESRIMMSLPARYVKPESTMLNIVDNIYFPTMEGCHTPGEEKDTTDLDDFLYYPAYQIINKTLQALQDCEPDSFPPVVPPFSLSLFSDGVERQSTIDIRQEDDVRLTQFLLELAIQEKFQVHGGFMAPPNEPEDIITRYLRLIIKKRAPGNSKAIPTWIIFGAALLLDIWRILGDNVGDSYTKLLEKSAMAKAMIRYTSPGTMEYDTTREDFIEIWQDIHNSIEHNPIPCMKYSWLSTIRDKEPDETAEALAWNIYSLQQKEVKERVARMDEDLHAFPKLPKGHQSCAAEMKIKDTIISKNLSTKWIRHETDPAFFLRQNPLGTGLRTLRLKLSLERAGLEFVLSNGTSFSIAHIYNAGQQMNYIKGNWSSLDKFIDANLHDIFTGGRPTTTHEFYTRALLGMGYSSTNLVQHRRQGQIQWRDVYDKWKQPDVSKLLEQAHSSRGDMNLCGDTIARCMFKLREYALANRKLPELLVKKLSYHHRTPIQILGELRDFLPGIMEKMDIDYITVTRKCDILMAQLHVTLAKLGFVVPIMPHRGSENFQLMINIMGHNIQHLRPDILKIAAHEIARYMDRGDADWVEDVGSLSVPSSVAMVSSVKMWQAGKNFTASQVPYAVVRAMVGTSVLKNSMRPLWKGFPKSLDKEMSAGGLVLGGNCIML